MSATTLKIDRLSYLGPNKPPVHVDFSAGLNILCGASESGKSFVLETVDWPAPGSVDTHLS